MKVLAIVLWLVVGVSAQEPPRYKVGTPMSLSLTPFPAQTVSDAGLDRYEITIDGGETVQIPIDTVEHALPRFAPGSHAISIVACNPDECGEAFDLSLTVLRMTPPRPIDPKIKPQDTPINLEQAASMANGYKALLDPLQPTLTPTQLQWLA
jgi:hypothetical protein